MENVLAFEHINIYYNGRKRPVSMSDSIDSIRPCHWSKANCVIAFIYIKMLKLYLSHSTYRQIKRAGLNMFHYFIFPILLYINLFTLIFGWRRHPGTQFQR